VAAVTQVSDTLPTARAPTPEAGHGSRRWSRWNVAVVVGVVGLVLVSNLVWIARDHQAPPWDQAHYLHINFQWRHALSEGGFHRIASAFYDTDPRYAPLYMLVITPFQAIRQGVNAALVANTIMLCGTVLAAAVVATRLYGQRAAPAAAVFVATCPIIYGLSRTPLVDTLLVLLVALAVMSAVVSQGFQRRGWAVLCGVFVGLATLTKITAPGVVMLPMLVSIALPERMAPKRQLTNATIAAIVAVVVALPWYAVNLSPSLDYLRSTTHGQLTIGTTGDPIDFHAFLTYASRTIDSAIGVILVLVVVVAGSLASRRLLHRRVSRRDVARIAIPASWFVAPFAALAVSHNQDIRYLAPGVTGIAVLAAGAIVAIRPRLVSTVVLGPAVAALAIQFFSFVAPFPSTGSAKYVTGPASFRLTLPFDGSSLIWTRRPGLPDYATPIVRALAKERGHERSKGPLDVCLLGTQQVVNGNTLGFVAETQGVNVTFTDLSYVPNVSSTALATRLSGCGTALYVPKFSGPDRDAVLNRSSAAALLTPDELAAFNGPRETFPVGDGFNVQVLRRAR
jgi:Dolichyl-phosphate-mannose-protein mannosyltransferase